MAHLLQDLRHSLRQLARRPVFTATAVLTLAIGMGVNAVAFSVVNGLLFKVRRDARHPDTVGRIADHRPAATRTATRRSPEFERFADATQGRARSRGRRPLDRGLAHDGTTETAWVLYVSPNYFSMVNPRVIAGQLRVERTGSDPPSVVIGERFWREKLASPRSPG